MPRRATSFMLVMLLCFAFGSSLSQAAEAKWDAVGIRGGGDYFDRHKGDVGFFQLFELFGNYALPWRLGTPPGLQLLTRVDVSAGALKREGDLGFIATLGPTLALRMFSERVDIDVGVALTYLERHLYHGRDLGGAFQFTSHGGVSVLIIWDTAIGYRIEHISNANIYPSNPGINFHMLELKHRF
jgi:lipid A 3-O-deacylase